MAKQACCSIPPIGQPTAVPEDQTNQAVGVNLCTYNNWFVACMLHFIVLMDSPYKCVWQSIGQTRCSTYLRHFRALPADQGRRSTPCPGIKLPGYYSRLFSRDRGRFELGSNGHRGKEKQIDGIHWGGSKSRKECSGPFLHHERNQVSIPWS